jgi:hypothetical protein
MANRVYQRFASSSLLSRPVLDHITNKSNRIEYDPNGITFDPPNSHAAHVALQ